MILRNGTLLQGGKYRIESMLGQGGFGITYLAHNTMLDGKVAIKEFFFKDFCNRDETTSQVTVPTTGNHDIVERFRNKFIKEARTLFRLNHPNIVRILDVFEENGTAYYVMDYIEGESLGNLVKRRGSIPEAEAIGYIREIGSALDYIHGKSMNHLDIKPANIMKRHDDGKILLIDFGVAKQYDQATSEGTTTTPVGISHGYSPAEQYRRNGVQSFSPQSDVYALAATLFKLLTGNTPPEAMEIQDEGLPIHELTDKGISSAVVTAIVNAMKSRSERTQSVAAFLRNLSEDDGATVIVDDTTQAPIVAQATDTEITMYPARERKATPTKKPQVQPASKPVQAKNTETAPDPIPTPGATTGSSSLGKIGIIAAVVAACIVGAFLAIKGCSTSEDSDSVEQPKQIAMRDVTDYAIVITTGPECLRSYTYTGELADTLGALPNGKGTAKYKKYGEIPPATYDGNFVNGLCNDTTGQATMTFENGDQYVGNFKDGYYTTGKYIMADKSYFEGTFKNTSPYNGKWYTAEGSVDTTVENGVEK